MAIKARSPCQYYDVNGKKFEPTLLPYPHFDAASDAETLCRSMRAWGTDEQKIIDVLGRRTSDQRTQIVEEYKKKYHRELASDLSGDLSGHFRDCAILLTETPIYLMAKSLFYALSKVGTNESTLIEILVGCSNEEIQQLKASYIDVLRDKGVKDPKRTLEGDIYDETSGHFRDMLMDILKCQTFEPTETQLQSIIHGDASMMINAAAVSAAVRELQEALQKPKDSCCPDIIDAFKHKNPYELAALEKGYRAACNKGLTQAISAAVSGELGELLMAMVEHATNRPRFYSEALYRSMVGAGTRDFLLMRIMILRAEIDLRNIEDAYNKEHKSLVDSIKGDTEGYYEKLLLTLLNAC